MEDADTGRNHPDAHPEAPRDDSVGSYRIYRTGGGYRVLASRGRTTRLFVLPLAIEPLGLDELRALRRHLDGTTNAEPE